MPSAKTSRTADMPIFWEFVQFVIDSPEPMRMDEHWRPIASYCSPCTIPYHFIVKLENHNVEERFVKRLLAPQRKLPETRMNHLEEEMNIEELTGIYFQMLDDQDVIRLYKIYEADFKMFGYEFSLRNLSFPVQ